MRENNTQLTDYFVAVDWGTSVLKAFLCCRVQKKVELLASQQGAGVKFCQHFENELLSIISPWIDKYGVMPVNICGMVGSNIGWKHVDYVACPTHLNLLSKKSTCFDMNGIIVNILPGLSCQNMLNMPDFIRGEETQIAGWVSKHINTKNTLLCLPGTHTKWVIVKNGVVETFLSSLQGEMFDILSKHSIICTMPKTTEKHDEGAFYEGVLMAKTQAGTSILHQLFTVRAKQIQSSLPASGAHSFLSGLLITTDILGAISICLNAQNTVDRMSVIGNIQLTRLYRQSADILGINTQSMSADEATILGIDFIYNKKPLHDTLTNKKGMKKDEKV